MAYDEFTRKLNSCHLATLIFHNKNLYGFDRKAIMFHDEEYYEDYLDK